MKNNDRVIDEFLKKSISFELSKNFPEVNGFRAINTQVDYATHSEPTLMIVCQFSFLDVDFYVDGRSNRFEVSECLSDLNKSISAIKNKILQYCDNNEPFVLQPGVKQQLISILLQQLVNEEIYLSKKNSDPFELLMNIENLIDLKCTPCIAIGRFFDFENYPIDTGIVREKFNISENNI